MKLKKYNEHEWKTLSFTDIMRDNKILGLIMFYSFMLFQIVLLIRLTIN
jgi:hypothetical protein